LNERDLKAKLAGLFGDLDFAADQAITARRGDAREAVKVLIVANDFLKGQRGKRRSQVPKGCARGRFGGG
jgi:hypothetical protein